MSYSIHAYAVEQKAVQKTFGSQDEAFLNSLVHAQKWEIQQLRDMLDSDLSPLDALKDIISGSLQAQSEGAMYAHVTELICRQLGQELANSEWNDLSMNWLMDINMEATLPIAELPLPLDFPYVLSILNKDIEDFVDLMGALDLEEESAWEQFEGWLSILKKGKKDLVLFFY